MRYKPLSLATVALFGVCALLIGMTALGGDGLLKSGIDRGNFDTAVRPGQDFYEYVNGYWIRTNPIPPEYSRWGAFPKLRDDNFAALRQIVEGLTGQSGALDADRRKLRDFYLTAMDEARLEQQGVSLADFDRRKSQAFWRELHELVPQWDEMIHAFNRDSGMQAAAA